LNTIPPRSPFDLGLVLPILGFSFLQAASSSNPGSTMALMTQQPTRFPFCVGRSLPRMHRRSWLPHTGFDPPYLLKRCTFLADRSRCLMRAPCPLGTTCPPTFPPTRVVGFRISEYLSLLVRTLTPRPATILQARFTPLALPGHSPGLAPLLLPSLPTGSP